MSANLSGVVLTPVQQALEYVYKHAPQSALEALAKGRNKARLRAIEDAFLLAQHLDSHEIDRLCEHINRRRAIKDALYRT